MVTLKNGSNVENSIVSTTMSALRVMMGGDLPSQLAVIELVEYLRAGQKIEEESMKLLVECGLIKTDGRVHEDIKNIVLSAAHGEGISIEILSPYAE
jgi:hypothetical protein